MYLPDGSLIHGTVMHHAGRILNWKLAESFPTDWLNSATCVLWPHLVTLLSLHGQTGRSQRRLSPPRCRCRCPRSCSSTSRQTSSGRSRRPRRTWTREMWPFWRTSSAEETHRVVFNVHVTALCRLAEDVDMRVVVFEHFGKNVPKTFSMSPDAFIQVALQLAYYRWV